MNKLLRLSTAFLGGLALLLGSAQSAQAAGSSVYDSQSSDGGALVQFRSYGDHMLLNDVHCDGRLPRVEYKFGVDYGSLVHEDHNGCGSGWWEPGPWGNMAEGEDIWFRACNVDANGARCASRWIHATA